MTDELLLGVAGITATVAGLFVVGVFFFVDAGGRGNADGGRAALWAYMRAGTRIVLLLFAMALMLPLALVAFDVGWARGFYVVMSGALVTANVHTALHVGVTRVLGTRTMLANEILGTVGVAAIVLLPWILSGGWPSREHLTLSALIALGTALASVGAISLSAFDVAHVGAADGGE